MSRALQRLSPAIAMLAMLGGCPRGGDGNADAPERPSGDRGEGRALRVGNPSRGVDEQPDYDGFARRMKSDVEPRLPNPLPPSADACTQMLDAAVAMYRRTEADGEVQASRLAATRAKDLEACEVHTSSAAATCAAILLGDDAGELPWLLDQCSRAFPKA
jgi:hypothetical protein